MVTKGKIEITIAVPAAAEATNEYILAIFICRILNFLADGFAGHVITEII